MPPSHRAHTSTLDADLSDDLCLRRCRLSAPPARSRENLDPPGRLAFLERRRALLTQRLLAERKPATRAIDRYTRSLLEHRARSTQHDLDWIDELIAQERAEQLGDRTEGASA